MSKTAKGVELFRQWSGGWTAKPSFLDPKVGHLNPQGFMELISWDQLDRSLLKSKKFSAKEQLEMFNFPFFQILEHQTSCQRQPSSSTKPPASPGEDTRQGLKKNPTDNQARTENPKKNLGRFRNHRFDVQKTNKPTTFSRMRKQDKRKSGDSQFLCLSQGKLPGSSREFLFLEMLPVAFCVVVGTSIQAQQNLWQWWGWTTTTPHCPSFSRWYALPHCSKFRTKNQMSLNQNVF